MTTHLADRLAAAIAEAKGEGLIVHLYLRDAESIARLLRAVETAVVFTRCISQDKLPGVSVGPKQRALARAIIDAYDAATDAAAHAGREGT